MKVILILLSFLLTSYRPGCLKLDVILLIDLSDSVKGSEPFIEKACDAFTSRFILSETDFKIGIIGFGDRPSIICPLTSDQQTLSKHRNFKALPENTNIALGLKAASDELWGSGRQGVQKVIILISDGFHNGSGDVATVCATTKKTGIIIASVVIKDGSANDVLMEYIASPGFYVESSYGTLVNEIKKLDMCL